MLINELSKRTGVSIPTLRYYENYGLFKGVSDEKIKTNNYKDYDESIIEKIELVKGEKVIAFKMKRRKGFRKKRGHRTQYTQIKVTSIA